VIDVRYEEAVAALAAASWHKSTFSQGQNACVEVRSVASVIGVRDSKLGPASPILAFGPASWATFTDRLKDATAR
jgi:Domain of unknown function (DUF397)